MLALLALLPAALADNFEGSTSPGVSYGDSLPINNGSYVDTFRDIYNATVHAAFMGPNVTRYFPGGAGRGNWSLNMFIVADAVAAGNDNRKPYYTAVSIEMSGPEGFRAVDMDPSWRICDSVMMIEAKGRKAINGSCENIISDKCRKSIINSSTKCPTSKAFDTDECGDVDPVYGFSGTIGQTDEQERAANRTDSLVWRSQIGIPDQSGVHTERHDSGNSTAYDKALGQIFIVPVAYKPAKNSSAYGTVGLGDEFICLQANSFSEGSRTSDSEDNNTSDSEDDNTSDGKRLTAPVSSYVALGVTLASLVFTTL